MSGHTKKHRVCIIGAGPSGMSALYQHSLLKMDDKPEVVVYEKQDKWGGMWNLTWRTGTDEFGEPNHGGMYKGIYTNAPKECLELKDYTFNDHFKKATPSYMPREHIRRYIEGRWNKNPDANLKQHIKFNHAVRYAKYDITTEEFHVSVSDLRTQTVLEETFSHVIVAVGIFSSPNQPDIPGIETFQGRLLHSHDFRSATEFKGQRVLAIGGSFSAEDISIMCLKYGAKNVTCSWHKTPMGLNWPQGIDERPPVKQVSATSVVFEDETSADFDAIILCTGYICRFPFLENSLQLTGRTSMYPDSLYKGVVWMKGGNGRLFYIGVQNQFFTLPMFDVQATWIWRYIIGKLRNEPKKVAAMHADIQKWLRRNDKLASLGEAVDLQADYIEDLIEMVGIETDLPKVRHFFHSWLNDRKENIATFREKSFTSVHTGQKAVDPPTWMTNFAQ